jgi:hypothetical protein
MMTDQDIESELSYAYLHAVAAKIGAGCQVAARQFDNAGIDANLHQVKEFSSNAFLTDITINIQLKATTKEVEEIDGRYPYFLDNVDRYNVLRAETALPPKLLVVLFLPKNKEKWLQHTPTQLILQKCAYWVSLIGAPETANSTGQTVYLPKTQVFSPEGLSDLFLRIAQQEDIRYAG